jgi:invasion protein IalB
MVGKVISFRAAGAAVFLLACATAALAASPPASLWHQACDEAAAGHPCWVEQFAVAMPNKVVVAHVRFGLQQAGKTGIIAIAPLGVALIPGLQLILDGGRPITLPYERCSAQGCEASAVLDRDAVEKFKRGKTLTLRYTVAGAKTADIPIRLEGLTKALQSLAS